MTWLYLFLLIASALCFAYDAFVVNRAVRVKVISLGLLLFVLVPLLEMADRLT